MKGAIGFLIGIVGLCIFASASILIPIFIRRSEGLLILMILLVVAFVFLNVLIVGFYRMLSHLNETVLFPDDPYYHPLRGRALFFVGYIGLLLTLVFVVLISLLPEVLRFRISPREIEPLLTIAWFAGWAFFGCLLGGVLMQLSDVFHKAYFRAIINPRGGETDERYFDISHRGSDDRPRRRRDE